MTEKLPVSEEDLDRALAGKIPWTPEGLAEAMALVATLSGMSEEDLPAEIREAARTGPFGVTAEGASDMDVFEAAKLIWLYGKYGSQGHAVVFANYLRLTRAIELLADHFEELVSLGLVEKTEGAEFVGAPSDALIEALAALPFSEPRAEGDEVSYVFSFGEVVAKAREPRTAPSQGPAEPSETGGAARPEGGLGQEK